MEMPLSEFDFKVRYEVYRHFAEQGQAPGYVEIANHLQASPEIVRASYHALHAKHLLFLQPGSDSIRSANPFSAMPTRFQGRAGWQAWWANCAWDMLGIPAALGIEAEIQATIPGSNEPVALQVANGLVSEPGLAVYLPLPCRQWYDDLIFT